MIILLERIPNTNLELISGSLLEVSVKFNLRNSLSIPDTSVMMEGEKAYVYKVSKDNVVNKTEIKIGTRQESNIEVLSGLNIGDIIVAEGLKKVYPRSKIKPMGIDFYLFDPLKFFLSYLDPSHQEQQFEQEFLRQRLTCLH